MKKFSLVSLAIGAALAISPAMLIGQSTFNWSATDNGLVGSGTLTATSVGGGVWDITGMTGTFTNTNTSNGDQAFSGSIDGLTGFHGEAGTPSYNSSSPSADAQTDYYDDLLYLGFTSPASSLDPPFSGSGGGQLDSGGMVFNVDDPTAGVYEIQIQQIGSTDYVFIVNPDGTYAPGPGYGTLETNFNVPEGGTSLFYLLMVGVVCIGAVFFSSRNPIHIRA